MSNQVTVFDSNVQVPAHLANRIGKSTALADCIVTSTAQPINRISLRASRFRFIVGGSNEEHVWDKLTCDVVIVGAREGLAKSYYATAYSGETESVSPDCYSYDGKAPHSSVVEPKCSSCVTCPMNKFGSKISAQGKEAKACTDTKRLAVMLADNMQTGVFLLSVSPTALKPMNQYVNELRRRGIPPECIRTTLYFDSTVSYPRLQFKFGGFLTEEEQAKVDAVIGTEAVNRVIGLDTDEIVDAPAAPMVQPVEFVAPKPAPQVVDVTPEPAPEPVPEPAPAPKAKAVSGKPDKVEPLDVPVKVVDGDSAAELTAKLDALFS